MRWWVDGDGAVCGSFRLEPDEGAALVRLLDHLAHHASPVSCEESPSVSDVTGANTAALGRARAEAGTDQPTDATAAARADGLAVMVDTITAIAAADPLPQHLESVLDGSLGAIHGTTPVAAVEVHVDVEGLARLADGPVVSPATLDRLVCDATVATVVERDGMVLRQGRPRRTVSARQKRALLSRDGHCRFPGCHRRLNPQAHHTVHWRNGGRTDVDQLVLVCRRHHWLLHEGGYSCKALGNGRFAFFTPDGRRLPNHVEPMSLAPGTQGVRRCSSAAGTQVSAETPVPRSGGERFDLALTIDALLCQDGTMWIGTPYERRVTSPLERHAGTPTSATTGSFNRWPPIEPSKGALKAKMPPSAATSQ